MNPRSLTCWHSCGSTSTGRASLSVISCFLVVGQWHGRASTSTGRAITSGQGGQNFSPFSHHVRTKTYKINKNNTKQTKIKRLNPWVASHEALI